MVSVRIPAGALLAILAAAAPAGAHIGASVAKAAYTHPIAPVATYDDGSTHPDYSYVPEDADTHYRIDWLDGDIDPTGRFTFYYLDHGISDGVSAADVEMIGSHVVDTQGREADAVWVSCTCALDAGVVCPDLGVRWCDNFVDWDTSQVPEGTYWIAAVNHDPPFYVYNLSYAPVRVFHGAKAPPAVIVEFPDGLGHANRSYHIEVIPVGVGTMKLDLAWGDNSDPMVVLGPVHTIATGVPVVIGSDGMTGYDWDTSQLPNMSQYFVRATLTDDNGQVYSDSRFPEPVYHDPDAGAEPLDLSATIADDGDILHLSAPPAGCSCAVGERARPSLPAIACLLAALAIRRRARRRCSRSGCTG